MRFYSRLFIGATLLLATFNDAVAVETPVQLRLMPLGDSTTAGSYGAGKDGIGGYRAELARLCAAAKLSVDFVGSLNDPVGATFDADHEGHRAWRIDNVADSVAGWLRAARPDVVLVELGINDLIQGSTIDEGVARISRFLDQCQAALPAGKFYIAGILSVREPNDYRVPLRRVQDLNARLPELVAQHARRGLHAEFVDLPALCAFQTADFSPDGLHPSQQGYDKIAAIWFRIIRTDLR
jgi:lysophospholipase L1-like esterase